MTKIEWLELAKTKLDNCVISDFNYDNICEIKEVCKILNEVIILEKISQDKSKQITVTQKQQLINALADYRGCFGARKLEKCENYLNKKTWDLIDILNGIFTKM